MLWLSQNWFWFVVLLFFVFMHFGHGSHGGHGAAPPRNPNDPDRAPDADEPPPRRGGHQH